MAPTPVHATMLFLVLSSIWFVSFIVSPFVARSKGYAPYFWLFACGPIGLIVIACFPSAKKATTPEHLDVMQARANMTGAILTGVALFVTLTLVVPIALFG